MSARITINTTTKGELEIWLNEEGRDVLIRELSALGTSETNDHFHMGSWVGAELTVGQVAYRLDDKIVHAVKVLYRTDDEDRRFFPHVLS